MEIDAEFDKAFADDEIIIENDIKFKSALGIGDQAFKSLQIRENLSTFGEALGVGTAVAGVANTVTVGSLLGFTTGGIFGTGLLAGAATPGLNVVIAAGVLSAGAYVGFAKYLTKNKSDKILVTPKFINTPLDLLATSLANFFVPIGLKLGLADGHLHELEELRIKNFMVKEWGYSESFITKLIRSHKDRDLSQTYKTALEGFIDFTTTNPDCDEVEIQSSLIKLLKLIIEADGQIKESEEIQLDFIENYFKSRS